MASIDLRKNGTYRVRAYYGTRYGKQIVVSATYTPPKGMSKKAMEKDLQRFAVLFETAVKNGAYMPGMQRSTVNSLALGMSLAEYAEKYFYIRIESSMSPNTVRFYKKVVQNHILPQYGSVRLLDITEEHLRDFIKYLALLTTKNGASLAGSTVKRYATVFCSMLKTAHKQGLIETNPFARVVPDYPKAETAPVEAYDEK
ncbi:MAG: tyrosine-type recombinase/integrase family protein, partial [Synergistes sp.]|nr:tyrosine-type recombinase/integrase family protein [Synergistes sp.]